MTQRLTILGSTGSIGRQSLEVIAALGLSVEALTAHKSVKMMEEQARAVGPKLVVLSDEAAAHDLAVRMADTSVRVLGGREALLEAVTLPSADTVLTSVVGIAGLEPTLAAIDAGKTIALANKETLVCAGALVTAEAKKKVSSSCLWTRSTPPSSSASKVVKTGERWRGSSSPRPAGRSMAWHVRRSPK